jgi:hypothetical protein
VKPVALVADAILGCSRRAAPRSLPRSAPAALDPLYVDTIIRRWQAYAGVIARHAVSGQSFAELADELGRQA